MIAICKNAAKLLQVSQVRATSSFIHDIESASEYQKLTKQFTDDPRVLLFYSSYGKPSLNLKKKIEGKAGEYKKNLIAVDVELVPEVCEEFHVESVPTVFTMKGINIKDTFVGVPNDDKINEIIKSI